MRNHNISDDVFCYVINLPSDRIADLTIQTLAEHFRVSRCHISRSFHDDRGITLANFIQRRKLLLAERFLMQEPDLSVKSLAFRMGYADYQYFIARFKEQWGESPGRYRKLVGDMIS